VAGISVNWQRSFLLFGLSVLTAIVGVLLGALVGRSDAEYRGSYHAFDMFTNTNSGPMYFIEQYVEK
jgi:hypothetical protein